MERITFGELLKLYLTDHTDEEADMKQLEQLANWIVAYDMSKEDGKNVFHVLFEPPDQ